MACQTPNTECNPEFWKEDIPGRLAWASPGCRRQNAFLSKVTETILDAGIVRDLAAGVAKYCPQALVAIISNPVNSTVPIAAEVFRRWALCVH